MQAFNTVCPRDHFQPTVEKRKVKGHFGNEITTITLGLEGRSAGSFFSIVWKGLSAIDRQDIRDELQSRFDEERRLHVRLDKQECLRGNFRLKDEDPIKLQFSFNGASGSLDEVRDFLKFCEKQG